MHFTQYVDLKTFNLKSKIQDTHYPIREQRLQTIIDRIQTMSCGSILVPIGSRYGSVLVHTEDIFNLLQHEVVKHLQIGLAIDVPVKKVSPNEVVPH